MQDGKTTTTTMADVLNTNWGGTGYASYEGRLEDTGAAATSSTTEAPSAESVMDGIFNRQPEAGDSATADTQESTDDGGEQSEDGAEWATDEEAAANEDAESLLPTDDETDFADSVYQRYAKLHKIDPALLANPAVRSLLKATIESDRYAQQVEQEREEAASQENDLLEEQEEETADDAAPPPTPESPEWKAQRQQYFQQLERMANEVTSPDMADAFGRGIMAAWGITKPTAKDMERVKPMVETYTKFGINLMATVLPKLLTPGVIDRAVPGIGKAMEKYQCAEAWDSLRDSDRAFAEMPDYGTSEFRQIMNDVLDRHPYLETAVFRDSKGRPLDPVKNTIAKYKAVANIAAGRKLNPRIVSQAVQTGRALQRRAANTAANGKLGGGNSKGAFQKPQPKSFGEELREAYEKEQNPVVFGDGSRF